MRNGDVMAKKIKEVDFWDYSWIVQMALWALCAIFLIAVFSYYHGKTIGYKKGLDDAHEIYRPNSASGRGGR